VPDARPSNGLADLASLGPFFAVGWHSPGAAPAAPWRAGSELAGPSAALSARIAAVRTALTASAGRAPGEVEPRVAGSAVHLGLAARLIAPALGAAVLRCPIDLRPGGLWWRDELGGAMPLSVPAPAVRAPEATPQPATTPARVESGGCADDLTPGGPDWDRLLDETIAPLTTAVAQLVTVSVRVLWGNVASAVNTAAAQVARQRPELAPDAWQAAARLLADPRLHGEPCPPGPAFRRSSCCLFYLLAPGNPAAFCGDCVLGARRAG
jgi:hypothetical protein